MCVLCNEDSHASLTALTSYVNEDTYTFLTVRAYSVHEFTLYLHIFNSAHVFCTRRYLHIFSSVRIFCKRIYLYSVVIFIYILLKVQTLTSTHGTKTITHFWKCVRDFRIPLLCLLRTQNITWRRAYRHTTKSFLGLTAPQRPKAGVPVVIGVLPI